MSAIKVVIRILLHGDWVYDALGASDAVVADLSAGVQWMCVLCANATFFMRVFQVCWPHVQHQQERP